MVLCLFIYFLVLNFDWSIILIRKSFGASRHISGKLGVKLAITPVVYRFLPQPKCLVFVDGDSQRKNQSGNELQVN